MFLIAAFLAQNPVDAVKVQHHQDRIVFLDPYNITVEAEDRYGNPLSTDVFIDGDDNLVGQTPGTFTVSDGEHLVFVNDFFGGGYRYCFEYWILPEYNQSNPITVTETENLTAVFMDKNWPGDVTGDGRVDYKDIEIVYYVLNIGSNSDTWFKLCDVNGDGNVNPGDLLQVRICLGNYYGNDKVGGIQTSVDKFSLLAPYIALASTILAAIAATAIYVKRRKKQ